MLRALALLPFLVLLTSLHSSGEPARIGAIPGDEQDLIFLHDSRPYRIRLHLQHDGWPAQAVWESYPNSSAS